VAGDIVATGCGFFSASQNLARNDDDTSRVGEAAFHGTGGKNGDGVLFDAAMSFFCGTVTGTGSGEGFLDGLEQARLIAFHLLEVFAAFLDREAGGGLLVVERVGRDGFAIERRKL
jgi:hypothetical protein